MADTAFDIKSDSPVAGELMFWRIVGHEALARPSMYELVVLSENNAIDAKDILGRAFDVVIEFLDADGGTHERHCQGHAVRFTRAPQAGVGRYFVYRIILRSWLWLLTKRSNSRVLQDMPVLEVLDAVFEDSPILRFKKTTSDKVIGSHPAHRYCVQYQESDYRFLSRLMEEEGIYYWFDAHDAPGTMHLSDASDVAHEKLAVTDTLHFVANGTSEGRDNEITRWVSMRQFDTGKFASRDSDFKSINKRLSADKGDPDTHELADLESFEFPGGYFDGDDTDNIARVRLDELIGRRQRHWALTSWPDVAVGRSFTLASDPDGTLDGDYIIAACTFVVSHPGYEGAIIPDVQRSVSSVLQEALSDDPVNSDTRTVLEDLIADIPALSTELRGVRSFLLTVIPADVPWRPPRLTPRVTMPGPQSAIVVGKQGEEIWTDKYGRVKVQFHWDRYGKNDENSSCWIRVSQSWAGKRWGAMSIPRIGQEVIVDFLEGDPDRPIITGCVYNGDAMPPYKLPGEMTKSTIKTYSSKGGGGFNEIRFEDKKGSEQLFMHSERNQDNRVKNDSMEWIGKDRHLIVKTDQKEKVEGDKHLTVKGDQNEKVGGAVSLSVGSDLQQKVGSKHAVDAGQEIHLKAGINVVIESGASLTLKVGGNFISIDSAGIFIKGTMVMINSGGAAGSGSGCSPEGPAEPTEADKADPGEKLAAPKPQSPPPSKPNVATSVSPASPQATALKEAAKTGVPFCEKCEAARRAQAGQP